MKNPVEFKVGDLVYYAECKKICKIVGVFCTNIVLDIGKIRVCIPRMSFFGVPAPIFHATQENYELLSKLYPNVTFEPPPKRKEPKEIIKAMFDSGKWFLVNYRGYGKLGNPPKNKTVTKEQFEKLDMNGYFDKNAYANVEVFCPNTGKTIIDFIDGEVVLESEND